MYIGAITTAKKPTTPAPRPPALPFSLPTWAPYAVGAVGIAVVIFLVMTAKGGR